MNKHFYRLIFNKARGMVMVVAEIVKRHQGEGRSSQKAKASLSLDKKMTAALKPLSFLTFVALGMVSVVAQSSANTIIADKSADKSQQATIIDGGKHSTVVNIQEANQAGVSHNKYTQFDVSQKGVILNNSAQSSTVTNIEITGRYSVDTIAGNSNLARSGSAKVILNEINSQRASQLNGYIEVVGQKAQVVIANAAGITCNRCGFINADRATLTTGKLIMGEDGKLNGYQVERGSINIKGEFDSSEQDYTDLIARAVNINDKIQAKNLTVITGKNTVSHDLQTIDKLDSDDNKPELAIDVAALGGMYADKIKLVSTETGVGVNNDGEIGRASNVDSIIITVDGKITHNGGIGMADTNIININASEDIDSVGSIYGHNIDIVSLQDFNIHSVYDLQTHSYASGSVGGDNVNIVAETFTNEAHVQGSKSLVVRAKDVYNMNYFETGQPGWSQPDGYISIIASGKIYNEGYINGRNISLNGKQGIVNTNNLRMGFIRAENLSLISEQTIMNEQNADFYGNNIDIKAMEVVNRGGISSGYNMPNTVNVYIDGKLTNEDWMVFTSIENVNITVTQDINNKGKEAIINANNLNLVSQQAINNSGGKIYGYKNLTLQASDVLNTNDIHAGNDLTIIADGIIDNSGVIKAGQNINLAVNTLNNDNYGLIHSKGNLNIGGKLDDNGQVVGKAETVNNVSSTISADGKLTINAEKIN
ncbi:filamentous hemagglutinin N-terminal domain-containing protein [Orbus wheelerorum]|uniref:two-partner secretion domain-containing protein n=1 Tax=Orbus wheelerorum TaxID=3074111 RepID=UPI00370D941E